MRKSLLQIVQAVTGELKIEVTPTVVISSTDSEVQLIRSLVIAACDELTQDYDWEQLITIGSFNTVAGQSAYPLPSDFVRLLDNTLWNATQHLIIFGPQSPERWARLTRGVVNSGPRYQFRLQGNNFNFVPVPGDANNIQYDYVTSAYVIDAGTGAQKRDFESDADRTIFSDRLLIDCVKLKYMETNGFDTTAVYQDFMRSLTSSRSGNTNGGTLSLLGSRGTERLIDTQNLPDGSYGYGGTI